MLRSWKGDEVDEDDGDGVKIERTPSGEGGLRRKDGKEAGLFLAYFPLTLPYPTSTI